MLGPSWIALFNRIPPKLHDIVSLTMVTGAEIVVQSLFRLESDYVILRGRMAGSTDAGRVVILPYDQITNLNFTKRMTEPELQDVFGQPMESTPAVSGQPATAEETPAQLAATEQSLEEEAAETVAVAVEEVATPAQVEAPPVASPAPGSSPKVNGFPSQSVAQLVSPTRGKLTPASGSGVKEKPALPSKAILLARLRARLAEQAGQR